MERLDVISEGVLRIAPCSEDGPACLDFFGASLDGVGVLLHSRGGGQSSSCTMF